MGRVLCALIALTVGAHGLAAGRSGASATRRQFFAGVSALSAAPMLAAVPALAGAATTTPSGVSYTVVTSGKGSAPAIGELAVLRWQASCKGVVFDDLFKTNDFYYHRVGSGNLVPGIEEVVLLMHAGDVWDVEVPGPLGFGAKGKKASPGQPSIPPNATLNYRLELLSVPGKDEDLIESIGGYEAAPQ